MTLNGTAGSAAILFGAGIFVQTILLSTSVRGKQWLTGAPIVEFNGPFECLCCPKGPRKFQNIVDLQ